MIEFADFECPYCSRFATTTLPNIVGSYVDTGKLLVVFRHSPIARHALALDAAVAAECAGRQNKFWQMHDALFEKSAKLVAGDFTNVADAIRLDQQAFAGCRTKSGPRAVTADCEDAARLRVGGTPTFFFGEIRGDEQVRVLRRLSGAVNFDQFRSAIDEMLTSGTQVSRESGEKEDFHSWSPRSRIFAPGLEVETMS